MSLRRVAIRRHSDHNVAENGGRVRWLVVGWRERGCGTPPPEPDKMAENLCFFFLVEVKKLFEVFELWKTWNTSKILLSFLEVEVVSVPGINEVLASLGHNLNCRTTGADS